MKSIRKISTFLLSLISEKSVMILILLIGALAVMQVNCDNKIKKYDDITVIRLYNMFKSMPNAVISKDSIKFVGKITYSKKELEKMLFKK